MAKLKEKYPFVSQIYFADILEDLMNAIDSGDITLTKTGISNAGGLVIPTNTINEKELVGYDENKTQIGIKIGEGLELDGETSPFTLKASGGDTQHLYEHIVLISSLKSEQIDGVTYGDIFLRIITTDATLQYSGGSYIEQCVNIIKKYGFGATTNNKSMLCNGCISTTNGLDSSTPHYPVFKVLGENYGISAPSINISYCNDVDGLSTVKAKYTPQPPTIYTKQIF